MTNSRGPRIAILGIALESNQFAPVSVRQDFEDYALCEGQEILDSPILSLWLGTESSGKGFLGAMSQLRQWTPVPILVADGQSGGPCDHDFFLELVQKIEQQLYSAGPVDGVYIIGHGAGTTTQLDDMDGYYFAAVRQVVGPEIPIVATLDLHGNVSDLMIRSVNILVSQRTNPHLDSADRGAEAAVLLHRLLNNETAVVQHVNLPLITAQVSQLTTPGEPLRDLISYGEQRRSESIANISILPGFAFSDTSYNGMSIIVTSVAPPETAHSDLRVVAHELASFAWNNRYRFQPNLVPLDAAIELARCAVVDASGPIILADVADNPGGGARGNTMWLIEALHAARIAGVLVGNIYDPALVSEAIAKGEGTRFVACFNADEESEFSRKFEVEVTVRRVVDGDYQSTVGVYSGTRVPLGRSCVLALDGIEVVVTSIRQQLLGADCFSHFGLDSLSANVIVAKSRGHFRAGFADIVPDAKIHEVDCPGLTTANLQTVHWQRLPRPCYPLDQDTQWPYNLHAGKHPGQ